jgi:hypothetical protein
MRTARASSVKHILCRQLELTITFCQPQDMGIFCRLRSDRCLGERLDEYIVFRNRSQLIPRR